ncbi:FAD synthetase/riboflavin kinase [Acididesulfobacillus acetoxydans]|uniref:Riboflavin biosynthesis protein n=1 Tax=Acididesulfobacillus acetoxydans TaxID=1561005 RepID=A0A8S0WQC4_9FIRM|nr:bifunctional riboflavin kinase/FAD synthetase [Acididesulfobacillus acetoxydans]CAA7602534.1 FAD synthetase/riboflavin kinase [Acididesulfobacillus acetoxydans]CEJ06515.1 Riboflavin biosynthesis protein RibC [Acididesulfobacillus acetoxydans]
MQVIEGLPDKAEPSVLALGNFDGVHQGHRRLLAGGLAEARRQGIPLAVLVFYPHPWRVLFPERELKLLTTQQERLRIFAEVGVGIVYLLPFTRQLAEMTPEQFVRDIVLSLNTRHIMVGFNYSFGSKGMGTPADLSLFGERYGFKVSVLQAQAVKGKVISSSAIRRALSAGDISLAREMLGRCPCLCGKVVSGEQRGRQLGFPTANLLVPPGLMWPKRGVYAVRTVFTGRTVYGMMNIGMKPTFHAQYSPTVEVHFIDFEGDLYGKELSVSILERLRDERKFADISELKEQLAQDARRARRWADGEKGASR